MSNFEPDELSHKQAAMIAAMPRYLSARAALEVACKTQTHTTDLLMVTLDKAGLLRLGAQPFGRDKAANLQLENAVEAWVECLNRPDGDDVVTWPAVNASVADPAQASRQLWSAAAMQERFAQRRAARGSLHLTV